MTAQNLLSLAAGGLFGAVGWLVVGVYIQRRQFKRESKNAGRAVYFELAVNEVNVAVALAHGVFQPLARSSFDRLLPELSTWLSADELQTVVQAYTSHAGYEQVQRDPAVTEDVRRALLERARDVHRRAIAALRDRSFDADEVRRMGLETDHGPQAVPPLASSGVGVEADWHALMERYFDAFNQRNPSGVREALAEGFTEEYPQSGERIRGVDHYLEMLQRYPGGPGRFADRPARIVGGEERWGLSPTFTPLRVSGGDGSYTVTSFGRYADGSIWHIIKLVEIQGGRISDITSYYAPRFDAPDWRADLVESIDEPDMPDG